MNEDRETAYLPVALFVFLFVTLFLVSLQYRRPNPKVLIPLTFPPASSSQ